MDKKKNNLFGNEEGYNKFCIEWKLICIKLQRHKTDLNKIEIVIRKEDRVDN